MNYLRKMYDQGLFTRRGENTSVPRHQGPQMYRTIRDLTILTCPSCRGKMHPDTIVTGAAEQKSFTCEVCHYTMPV